MRIAERLARLESRAGQAQPGMTPVEIDAAAVVYEQRLREDGVPGGGTIEASLAGWRTLVERAAPSMQRIWANVEPWDLYA
ncbi:hypothetical protein U1872_08100 [Sphingomonas sp. RB3P16]|uniref:hypothetical protein n=1 Tax=Parasphingomonas frigoris TaxID=3096163 RepID=UPI002FCBA3D2